MGVNPTAEQFGAPVDQLPHDGEIAVADHEEITLESAPRARTRRTLTLAAAATTLAAAGVGLFAAGSAADDNPPTTPPAPTSTVPAPATTQPGAHLDRPGPAPR